MTVSLYLEEHLDLNGVVVWRQVVLVLTRRLPHVVNILSTKQIRKFVKLLLY